MTPRVVRYVAAVEARPPGEGDEVVVGDAVAIERIEQLARAGHRVTRVAPGMAILREELRGLVRSGLGAEFEPGWGVEQLEAVFGGAPVVGAIDAGPEVLAWIRARPLFGKRVLLTRAREQASETAEQLRAQGAEPLVVPAIEIHPPADGDPLRRALAALRSGHYAWVAFTSSNGVERTWAELVAGGADARAFAPARVAAIGPATARALERRGIRADVVAKEFRGEGLADAMLETMGLGGLAVRGTRVLLSRAAQARDALPEALRAAGCEVDVVAAYETRPPPPEVAEGLVRDLQGGRVDAVAFTSSSTVNNLCDLLGPTAPSLLARLRVAAIGPITRDTASDRGLRVDVVPAQYTVPALVAALAESYG
jgi:uroporphyrinogen III methyltransferase/synthase